MGVQREYLDKVGAALLRIPRGRREYNAVVERTHRTDDEEFYIPKIPLVKDRENFLYRAMQWTYYFNMHRVHCGRGMMGQTPYQRAKRLHKPLLPHICCFPPFILDALSPSLPSDYVKGGKDLCAHYRLCYLGFTF
jgi:hypothetical protein